MEDGVWRTVRGRRIFIKDGQSLTEAMKDSKKFANKKQEYDYTDFSKSKVKDVIYHGSTKDFEQFDTEQSIEGNNAIWFSKEKDYAEEMGAERGTDVIMYEVKINTQNPMEVTLPPGKFSDPTVEAKYIKEAKQKGYDSVIFTNDAKEEYLKDTFYAVFKPEQIKVLKKDKL